MFSFPRRVLDRLAGFPRVFAGQAFVAASFALAAFLGAVVLNASLSYMGNSDSAAASFIVKTFWADILVTQLRVLAVLGLGFLAVGTVAALCIHPWYAARGREPRGRGYVWLSFLVPAVLYAHLFGWRVLEEPAVFARTLVEKGGLRADLQLFLTEGPGPGYYAAFFAAVALAALAGWLLLAWRGGRLAALAGRLRSLAPKRVAAGAVVLLAAGGVLAFAARPAEPVRSERYNILVLASDALRPDRLSLFGYARDTSPALKRRLAGATAFTNTFCEIPRTFPAWVTLLCGQSALEHGIRHMFPRREERARDFPSLAKLLRAQGYGTAVVGDFAADIFPRIDLGFDRVDAPRFTFNELLTQGNLEVHTFLFPFVVAGPGRRLWPVLDEFAQLPDADRVADKALAHARSIAATKPFFVVMFGSTTHFPYANKHPYYKRFADPAYRGDYRYYKQQVVLGGKGEPEGADARQVGDLYDGGVRAFDDACGRLLDGLERDGLLERTIVVLVSDHGENLYEPGKHMGHGEHLRGDLATRIPFVVLHPAHRKRALAAQGPLVSAVDVAPTIAALAGAGRDPRWTGLDFSGWVTGRGPRPSRPYVYAETGIWFSDQGDYFFQKNRIMYPDITKLSEIDFAGGREVVLRREYADLVATAKHRMLRGPDWKLVCQPTRTGQRLELYDVLRDPANLHDLAAARPDVAVAWRARLDAHVTGTGREELANGYYVPID